MAIRAIGAPYYRRPVRSIVLQAEETFSRRVGEGAPPINVYYAFCRHNR